MKIFRFSHIVCIVLCMFKMVNGQVVDVKGMVLDQDSNSLIGITVILEGTSTGNATDENGYFQFKTGPGNYNLVVSGIGFVTHTQPINVVVGSEIFLEIILKDDQVNLEGLTVVGKSESQKLRETGYSVNAIETKSLQNQEVNINQLASRTAGIRVRESGGLGSSFHYSLDGMSGRSVRFFIDGVPLDRFGGGYSINNFPVNLVERVEIFKGVVPPKFGSDALGGVINLVTKNKSHKYIDASYSIGSFNTHRAALSTRWTSEDNEFYVDLQSFFNYSDNDYEVWGQGVEVADPQTGRARNIRTKRFHDQYRSASGKLGIGFINKPWADQLNFTFVMAGNNNEIQHGATMAHVYGEAMREDRSYSPSLFYNKEKIFDTKLNLSIHSSVSFQNSMVIDTSSRAYNWLGEIVDEQPTNSELGRGRNGKSLLNLNNKNWFQQANLSYPIGKNQVINAIYTFDHTIRDGSDPLLSNRTASFVKPQHLRKQVSSLSYELSLFDSKLQNSFWVKNYNYSVETVDERYITDSLGYRPETYPVESTINNIGYGYALKWNVNDHNIFKFSMERSYRLPDANEVLGDGLLTRPSPNLKPEKSLNFNIGWLLNHLPIGQKSTISLEPSVFFRNMGNKIQYAVSGNLGGGSHANISKVRGWGGSLDFTYDYNDFLRLKGNATYQQLKDWNEYSGASKNLTYKDLLPNTPYFMSNGGVYLNKNNLLFDDSRFTFYWDVQYVHEFYLRWPSLGNQNKANIPTQLTHSTGVSYSLNSGKYNFSFGCQNVFDRQVYDNYLLQKPGRSFYLKFRYFIQQI